MLSKIYDFVNNDDRIRLLGMEGSRVNENIEEDIYQDYDISFFVEKSEDFIENRDWIDYFGEVLMMQTPEDMELFPASEIGFSFLILFKDHTKMDISIFEIEDLEAYLKEDSLRTILIDKDKMLKDKVHPSDKDYHIGSFTSGEFDDSLNEFYHLSSYVTKGLLRREILFAIDHLDLMREELLRLISWNIGLEYGFDFSLGKNYKFIDRYIPDKLFQDLLETYNTSSYEKTWASLFIMLDIFADISVHLSQRMGFEYPYYRDNMEKYIMLMYKDYLRMIIE